MLKESYNILGTRIFFVKTDLFYQRYFFIFLMIYMYNVIFEAYLVCFKRRICKRLFLQPGKKQNDSGYRF